MNLLSQIAHRFFRNNAGVSAKSRRRGRTCRFEHLEERELLAVTMADFDAIKAQYADLELTHYALYTIREINVGPLSATDLTNAINNSKNTVGNDLIVIRTTEANHTITGTFSIGIPSGNGSITIVSLGTVPLIINGNQQGPIFNVSGTGTTVALAGLTLTGGRNVNLNGLSGKYGGAIHCASATNVTVSHCTIKDCMSNGGGGIYVKGALLTISNSVITGNTAHSLTSVGGSGLGGGIYNDGGTTRITNCTIAANTAGRDTGGGGIHIKGNSAILTMNNTIVVSNIAPAANYTDVCLESGTFSGRNNFFGKVYTTISEKFPTANGNILGATPDEIAGLFVNAGAKDFRLAENAVVINKGSNAFVRPNSTDLAGNPRIVDVSVDIGAYEAVPIGYNIHDWTKVAALGLLSCATWEDLGGEKRLTAINAPNKGLTGAVDLSNCILLETLNISGNAITELNVANTALKTLSVAGTSATAMGALTSLNVSNCASLKTLNCNYNPLSKLTLDGCVALESLNCAYTNMSALDVSNMTALHTLYVNNGRLSSLNVTGCSALRDLRCNNNRLTFASLPAATGLTTYHYGNQSTVMATMDSQNTVDLSREYMEGTTTYDWYYGDGITPVSDLLYVQIDGVFTFIGLNKGENIYCVMTSTRTPDLMLTTSLVAVSNTYNKNDGIKVVALGLSVADTLNPDIVKWQLIGDEYRLVELHLAGKSLSRLDVSGCTALNTLDCSNNPLTSLDVAGLASLHLLNVPKTTLLSLSLSGNILPLLKLSDFTALEELRLSDATQPVLEISSNRELKNLTLVNCVLASWNISNNSTLVNLSFYDCSLTILTATNVSALKNILFVRTELASLNLTDSKALKSLKFDTSIVATLTTAGCTSLSEMSFENSLVSRLDCSNNQLSGLNLSACLELQKLNCTNNQLLFSTLVLPIQPPSKAADVTFAPQALVPILLRPGNIVNLSSEYLGGKTTFTWKNAADNTVVTPATSVNGVFTFSNLTNGMVIYCEMTNADVPGTLKTKNVTIGTFTIPLTIPVVTIVTTATTSNSITLSWQAVDRATGYVVQWKTETGAWQNYSKEPLPAAGVVVDKLEYNTTYQFRVRAVNDEDQSEYSGIVSETTKKLVVERPATPTNFRNSGKTASSVSLIWDAVDATSYEIQWKKSADASWGTPSTYARPAIIVGLEADTAYDFQVRAVNSAGSSDWSTTISVTTPTASAIPLGAPTVQVGTPKATAVVVSWNTVTNAEKYTIEWSTTPTFANVQIGYSNTNSFEITSLSSNTSYWVHVIASTDKEGFQDSAPSLSVSFTTATQSSGPLSPPTNVEVKPKSETELIVTWTGDVNAEGYVVELYTNSTCAGAPAVTKYVPGGDSTETTIGGLESGIMYYVRVIAKGNGTTITDSEGSELTDKTNAAPSVVLDVFIITSTTGTTANSITLNFDENAGLYKYYNLQYKKADGDWIDAQWAIPKDAAASMTVYGLDANATYEFRLISKIDGSTVEVKMHDSSAIKTANEPHPSITDAMVKPKVKPDKAANKGKIDEITLTFDGGKKATKAGNASYEVEYWITVKGIATPVKLGTFIITGGSYTFTNLQAGTSYTFAVKTLNANGEHLNKKGKEIVVTKKVSTAKFVAVKGKQVMNSAAKKGAPAVLDNQSINSVTVKMTIPKGYVGDGGYNIEVWNTGKTGTKLDATDWTLDRISNPVAIKGDGAKYGHEVMVKISGLPVNQAEVLKGKKFVVKVTATKGFNKSIEAKFNVTTAKYTAPKFAKPQLDSTKATLSWTDVKVVPETTHYIVYTSNDKKGGSADNILAVLEKTSSTNSTNYSCDLAITVGKKSNPIFVAAVVLKESVTDLTAVMKDDILLQSAGGKTTVKADSVAQIP